MVNWPAFFEKNLLYEKRERPGLIIQISVYT